MYHEHWIEKEELWYIHVYTVIYQGINQEAQDTTFYEINTLIAKLIIQLQNPHFNGREHLLEDHSDVPYPDVQHPPSVVSPGGIPRQNVLRCWQQWQVHAKRSPARPKRDLHGFQSQRWLFPRWQFASRFRQGAGRAEAGLPCVRQFLCSCLFYHLW